MFTCEEATRLVPPLPGAEAKNLFLRDRRGKRHFLVAVAYEVAVDLTALSHVVGASRLSMASPPRLQRHLGVEPGAVSLLAVANDRDGAVEVIIDQELWRAEQLCCHPLVNTSTLVLARSDLARFLESTGHAPLIIPVPGTAA